MNVNLRIPGPTPCPPDVLEACSRQMINHRGPEFAEMIARQTSKLQKLCSTKHDFYIMTASGTGVMEAAIVNTLSPGDKVLNVSVGVFGDRFGQIAEAYGAKVTSLKAEWGKGADPEEVARAVQADRELKAVLITHNETSTGVTNKLGEIAKAIRRVRPDILILVDAISSLGAVPLPIDEWDLDVVVTGSQKGWMVPPALGFVVFGPRAWQAYEKATMPRFYFDVGKAKDYLQRGQTPWTPAVSVFFGLEPALDKLEAEGIENIFARHHRVAEVARQGVKSLGLEMFSDESVASDTISAVKVPGGVDGVKLVKVMREEHGVVLAGGQTTLAGKIFRIGHLGWVFEPEVQAVIDALRVALPKLGYQAPTTAPAS
ncbi:MAG: alanine--glyoxylate aminotransferase family protein [Dehalococcoidia bacterium]